MTTTALLVLSLIAAGPATGPSAEDLKAYDALKAQTGRDPAEQVRLALWCESRGLQTERLKHLALAVLADPTNAMARGLMGVVAYRGQWKRPESVAEKVKADEALTAKLAEYNTRRARAAETADAQWALALWCEQNDLPAEAQAHFTAVTRLDASREAAWKRLGCKKVNGRWVTDAQLAAEKEESETQKKADKYWKPLLTKYRGMLGERTKHDAAELALFEVVDPRAVPSVWSVFIAGLSQHDWAVKIFGRIDSVESSRSLAFLAVFDDSAEVRRAATETLKRRDPREFAARLVGLLRDPLKFEVRPVGGPGSVGVLFVDYERFNQQRVYAPPPLPPQVRIFADSVPFDPFNPEILLRAGIASKFSDGVGGIESGGNHAMDRGGLPPFLRGTKARLQAAEKYTDIAALRDVQIASNIIQAQNIAATVAQQLANDVAAIEERNDEIRAMNSRVSEVLTAITGEDLGETRAVWASWITDTIGYAPPSAAHQEKPTFVENVTGPRPIYFPTSQPYTIKLVSCFGAGTLVRTLDGSQPIESIKVGDRVLTQDIKTGTLGYNPVTVVHHNPPSPTFLVKLGSDTIVSSPFHRFWIVGKGWIMARDLKGGETLRLLTGTASVASVESGPVQLVYNLDVADAHDFFAGAAAALVHDNTLPETRITPFDVAPVMSAGVALK